MRRERAQDFRLRGNDGMEAFAEDSGFGVAASAVLDLGLRRVRRTESADPCGAQHFVHVVGHDREETGEA